MNAKGGSGQIFQIRNIAYMNMNMEKLAEHVHVSVLRDVCTHEHKYEHIVEGRVKLLHYSIR